MDVTNIQQIWNTFSWPVVEVFLFSIVLWYLDGKMIGKYCIRKYKALKEKKPSWGTLIRKIHNSCMEKTAIAIFVILFIVFFFHRIIGAISRIVDISYTTNTSSFMVNTLDEHILASIWGYYPNSSLGNLYSMIVEKDRTLYGAEAFIHNIKDLATAVLVIAIILLVIRVIRIIFRSKEKTYVVNFKTVWRYIIVLISMILVVNLSIIALIKISKDEFKQQAYAFEAKCIEKEMTVQMDFDEVIEKINQEKEWVADQKPYRISYSFISFYDIFDVVDDINYKPRYIK